MSEAYLDTPASPPMREVWIWIGHYADGTEGMIAADVVLGPGLIRHAPLMNSRREVAERLGEVARKAAAVVTWRKHREIAEPTPEAMAKACRKLARDMRAEAARGLGDIELAWRERITRAEAARRMDAAAERWEAMAR